MKRSLDQHPISKRPNVVVNEYAGAIVSDNAIDETASSEGFFEKYVVARKPVKITAKDASALCPINIARFRVDKILETLPAARKRVLQVEKKHALGFGLGKKRESMTFEEIVERLAQGDESLYLTTQYEEHDYDELNELDGESNEEGEAGDVGKEEADEAREDEEEDEEEEETTENEGDDDASKKMLESNPNGDDDPSDASSPDPSIDLENLHDDFDDVADEESFVIPEHQLTQDEVDYRVSLLLQAPLTELYKDKSFPLVPENFGPLIPQQINLWMGACSNKRKDAPDLFLPSIESLGRYVPLGNSSGLHHDHADNLYVLVQGRKRFTLFSPQDAEALRTVGELQKIYPNGLIDYKTNQRARFWRPMRADGAMIGEWARWMIEKEDFKQYSKEQLEKMIENDVPFAEKSNLESNLDPPSFSTVPPLLAHLSEISDERHRESLQNYANKHFPGFLNLHKLEVWLEPGDMLYLPTGWFHEVTSFAEDSASAGAHVALNWWFVPPTGGRDRPYPDEYWKEDYEKTLASIEYKRAESA
uniref:JmjC domain-containing protein n=1 Tax=Candidozyma auris TaxID=498019 RepID=A0A0L0NPY5_CANAR